MIKVAPQQWQGEKDFLWIRVITRSGSWLPWQEGRPGRILLDLLIASLRPFCWDEVSGRRRRWWWWSIEWWFRARDGMEGRGNLRWARTMGLCCVPISIHFNVVHYPHSLSALILRCQCRSKLITPWCTKQKLRSRLPLWLLPRNKHPALNGELFTHSSYKKL